MEFRPMWPKRRKKSPSLPLGVHIIYEEGDEVELLHLLDFLRTYFALTKEDFTEENLHTDEERFPRLWLGEKPASFKHLLKETEEEREIGEAIDLGFLYADQLVFRAYKAHLDQDDDAEEWLKKFFAIIEGEYCGTPSRLN
jgi:hypothetical protein